MPQNVLGRSSSCLEYKKRDFSEDVKNDNENFEFRKKFDFALEETICGQICMLRYVIFVKESIHVEKSLGFGHQADIPVRRTLKEVFHERCVGGSHTC